MSIFIKRLAANELGETGANTRGEIYIPKSCLSFFPALAEGSVRRATFSLYWGQKGQEKHAAINLSLYRKGEAHLHRIPDEILGSATSGDILMLQKSGGVYAASIVRQGEGRFDDLNAALGDKTARFDEDTHLSLRARSPARAKQTSVVTHHPLADGIAPAWTSGWGEDAWGPFVELTVKDVTQRLRWIPAGRFQMGSSSDDENLAGDIEKPQHWVEISRGFWMFDTPTTQELWEAVMGKSENRSEFRSLLHPVERVSWDDCQLFFEKFSEFAPEVKLGLPTEAEWEYACRAGTTDATYAGAMEILGLNDAPILDSIAWYGGNCGIEWKLKEGNDTSWGEKQYDFEKGGTRVVATRVPNSWGLYDTLGNVCEWCRDASYRDYADEAVIDPFQDGEASTARVIRGGSWNSNARNMRAAYRNAPPTGLRLSSFGFRCRIL